MDKSKISWTDATWNFVVGCSKVSTGCQNCYAERLALRYGWSKKPWTAPNARENVIIKQDKLKLPLKWKTPRRIFVNSLSDLFHEQVPDEVIRTAFVVMGLCPEHTFQILTKRPARMKALMDSLVAELDFFADHWTGRGECTNHFPNVWLGVSVEDQRRADERIPLLLQTPAAIRFLSCEPLLGAIDLGFTNGLVHGQDAADYRVDWCIVGGESGPKFRPMNPDWARLIRDQCVNAGIPFFFKQHSGYRPQSDTLLDGVEWHQFPDEKGGENYVAADAQVA